MTGFGIVGPALGWRPLDDEADDNDGCNVVIDCDGILLLLVLLLLVLLLLLLLLLRGCGCGDDG